MKVYVFPADTLGCGYTRLIWPAQVLRNAGHEVEIIWPKQRNQYLHAAYDADGNLINVTLPPDADVIVLQRVSYSKIIPAIKWIRSKGIAVVIDIDDDLASIHPSNVSFKLLHPKDPQYPEHSWVNVQRACEAATLVQVSTPALLPIYASHGRGFIVKNCIPKRYLDIEHIDSQVFGWPGSVHSHPDDPQVIGNAAARLQRDGFTFRAVGNGLEVKNVFSLDREPEVAGELDLLTQWPQAIASLGVGVAPLNDTKFNRSKSWLKPLEMAAVGVPCVMSPRAEYAALHKEGVGYLADKPKQWYSHLKNLLNSESLRKEKSEQGRAVAAQHTVEENAWRWMEAWLEALRFERVENHALVGKRTIVA